MGKLDLKKAEGRLLASVRANLLAAQERARAVVAPFEQAWRDALADVFDDHGTPFPPVPGFDLKGDGERVVTLEWPDPPADTKKETPA